jgi:hypothetical protein
MKYLNLVNAHQQELNDFPIMWAFNDKQYEEALQRLGVKETERDEIVTINGGGIMRMKDVPAFREMLIRHKRERAEAFKDDEFAYDAFLYELANHEFCITYEYEPTLDALGLTEDDLCNEGARLLKILKKAKDDYLNGVEY